MNELVLDRRRLLWRTRGQYWDYLFLLRPEQPSLPGWLHVFEQVFSDDQAPAAGVFYAKSSLRVRSSGPQHYFVAAALTDPARCDFVGRRVQHFFIYMLRSEEEAKQFHSGWAEQLLKSLDDGLTSIFDAKRSEDAPGAFSADLLRKISSQVPEQLSLEQDALPVKWSSLSELTLGEVPIEDEKKYRGPSPTASGPNLGWLLLALVMLALLIYRVGCNPKEPQHPAIEASEKKE